MPVELGLTPGRKRLMLIGLSTGVFLASIESTVVSVAMPTVVAELGERSAYIWPIALYMVASTVSGPIWGRLSDVLERKAVYITGLITFTVGMLLCGFAWDMRSLIAFRVLQGIGGGALLVLTFTVIGDVFRVEERGYVTGYTSTVWAVSSASGPLLGGWLTESVGWRWIFLIGVAPGMAAAAIALRAMPRIRGKGNGFDFKGAALFALGTGAFMLLVESEGGWPELTPVLVGLGAAAIALFLLVERRAPNPLIPLGSMTDRYTGTAMAVNLVGGLVFFGTVSVMPAVLQWGLGFDPTTSGLIIVSGTLGWVVAANIASRLVVNHEVAGIIRLGVSLLAGSMALLSLAALQGGLVLIVPALMMLGFGMGMVVPPTLIATQTLASRETLGIVTSMLAFMRVLGGSIGSQLMWFPISASLSAPSTGPSPLAPAIGSFGLGLAVVIPVLLLLRGVTYPDLRAHERASLAHHGDY
ncbi:MAG: MFS transporter [Nitrososphaerota archaeon]